jgi:hypothetical protein
VEDVEEMWRTKINMWRTGFNDFRVVYTSVEELWRMWRIIS